MHRFYFLVLTLISDDHSNKSKIRTETHQVNPDFENVDLSFLPFPHVDRQPENGDPHQIVLKLLSPC